MLQSKKSMKDVSSERVESELDLTPNSKSSCKKLMGRVRRIIQSNRMNSLVAVLSKNAFFHFTQFVHFR